MKLRHLMVSIILIIFLMGFVSASDENITSDNLAAVDEVNINLADYPPEDILSENESEIEFEIEPSDKISPLRPTEIKFKGTQQFNGTLDIYTPNGPVTSYYENGMAVFNVTFYKQGINTLDYYFIPNDDHPSIEGQFEVNVLPLFKITLPNSIYENKAFKVSFTGPEFLNTQLYVTNSVEDTIFLKKGKADVTINDLRAGKKTISYYLDYKDDSYSGSFNVEVLKLPKITAKDFKMDYTSKSKYSVRISGTDGRYVGSGKTVRFELYKGSKKVATKTTKTDKNSYAKVNFNVAPGSYKIKAKYSTVSVTKKYTVNSILKIQNDKVKDINKNMHVSKKIVWSAYLKKVDGKYLKGKKIQFTLYKYNSKGKLVKVKTFIAKTNSKGVAKLTFKKSPVKVSAYNMRMGMAYPVKVTYSKDKLKCGDTVDPHYTLYGKYSSSFDYYWGPTWLGS